MLNKAGTGVYGVSAHSGYAAVKAFLFQRDHIDFN